MLAVFTASAVAGNNYLNRASVSQLLGGVGGKV